MSNILQFAPLPEDKEIETSPVSTTGTNLQFAPGEVKEKINLFEDSIYEMQEKTGNDNLPFVDPLDVESANLGFQGWNSLGYGFASSVSSAIYDASGVAGWLDRLNDNIVTLSGGDPEKIKMEYAFGDELAIEEGFSNYSEYQKLLNKKIEQKNYRDSLDKNILKKGLVYGAAAIDAWEESWKGRAKEITPTSMFNIDPYFQPTGVAEQVVAGFGSMPVAVAEYAAATAAAAGAIALATGTSVASVPTILAAGTGFAALSFLGSYEQEPGKVFYNTVVGFGEGAAFGSLNRLPGWKSRTVALGSIGAGSAALHGGGSTEIISGAITLATLGAAGRGYELVTGKAIPGMDTKKLEGESPVQWTFFEAKDVLSHDIVRLDRHSKPVREYLETEGKGYYLETEKLKFEIAPESKEALSKRKKKDLELELGNAEKLIVNKFTEKDISSGRDTVRFDRVSKETKLEDIADGVKPKINKNVEIPKEHVIKDGKFLDYVFFLDASTLKFRNKSEVIENKTKADRPAYEIIKDFSEKQALFDRYNNTGIISGKLKDVNETTISVSFRQLQKISKLRGKQHDWARNLIKEATRIKERRDKDTNRKFKQYSDIIQKNRDGLDRILNIAARVKPNPGESKARDAEELINSLVEVKQNPKNRKEKIIDIKKDKDGKDVERDMVGDGKQTLRETIGAFAEQQLIPLKLAGDATKNNIKLFYATKLVQLEGKIDAAFNDILYKQKTTYDQQTGPKFIEEKKGFLQGGVFVRFANALGGLKTYRSKDGALTEFEGILSGKSMFDFKGQREAIASMKKVIDTMIAREIFMEKKAAEKIKSKDKKKIKAEYLKKNEVGEYVYQMTYKEAQSRYNLTEFEVNVLKKLDKGLTEARQYHNKAMEETGGRAIEELPNYYPHAWLGNHRIYIKDPTTGELVGSIVGYTPKEVRQQLTIFRQNYPEYAKHPAEYVKKNNLAGKGRQDLQEAFFEASRLMEKKDPELSLALKESYREYQRKQTFARVKEERRGVVGNIAGTREGKKGLQDFYDVYKGYVLGAVRTAESARYQKETALLKNGTDPRVALLHKKFPQQFDFVNKYENNYFGRNPNFFAKGQERAIRALERAAIFEKLPGFDTTVAGVNAFTLYTKLLFWNARFLASQIVQPYQMAPQRLAWLQKEFNIKGDIGTALVEGSLLTFRPTKEFSQLIELAVKEKIIDTKFLNEFGLEVTKGGRIKGPFASGMESIGVRGLGGKGISGMMERHSRLNALAIMYSFLKSAKYDKANGKDALFRDAMWNTQQLMVEYNAPNRAFMYTDQGLGPMGRTFGLFKTFLHNYLGQTVQYARTIARDPKNFKSYKPGLFHLTSSILTAGMFGAIGVAQADGLITFINAALKAGGVTDKKIPTLTQLILTSDAPAAAKFGLPSALVGVDISSTVAAPGFGYRDIFSLPALDYLFGLTTRSNSGVIGESTNIFMKQAQGTYSDADMYTFLKATLPPILMAEVDRRYAGVPMRDLIVRPGEKVKLTNENSIYFESLLTRDLDGKPKTKYVVKNPYKGMRGSIERDLQGFQAKYAAAISFEESILLKTIWETTKMSRNQKNTIDAIVLYGAMEALNGRYDNLMIGVDMATDKGYTQEEYLTKVKNRMQYMNNTVLSRIKGLSKTYNMDQSDFIDEVLRNNNINLNLGVGIQ